MNRREALSYFDIFNDLDQWSEKSKELTPKDIRAIKRHLFEYGIYRGFAFNVDHLFEAIIKVHAFCEVNPVWKNETMLSRYVTLDRMNSTVTLEAKADGKLINKIKLKVREKNMEAFFRHIYISRDIIACRNDNPSHLYDAPAQGIIVTLNGGDTFSVSELDANHSLYSASVIISTAKEIIKEAIEDPSLL